MILLHSTLDDLWKSPHLFIFVQFFKYTPSNVWRWQWWWSSLTIDNLIYLKVLFLEISEERIFKSHTKVSQLKFPLIFFLLLATQPREYQARICEWSTQRLEQNWKVDSCFVRFYKLKLSWRCEFTDVIGAGF